MTTRRRCPCNPLQDHHCDRNVYAIKEALTMLMIKIDEFGLTVPAEADETDQAYWRNACAIARDALTIGATP